MKNLVVVFCLLFSGMLNAQTIKVMGSITFENVAVPEAFVTLKANGTYYATTNNEGAFEIEVIEQLTTYVITYEHLQFKAETRSFTYVEGQKLRLSFNEEQNEMLEAIVIDQTNKNVRRFADKTIFNVENMTVLSAGTVFEAINKLPGVLITSNGQIAHNGKLATIFLDGEPTGLSGDQLTNFLKNLPANSVKDIEIIDQPGAKYSATFSGTIINVITKAAKITGLSGSVMNQTSVNSKFKNTTSAQLMFKKNKFTWNLNTGYTHHEGTSISVNEFSFFNGTKQVSAYEDYWSKNWYQSYFLRNTWQYKVNDFTNFNLKYNYNHWYSKPKTIGDMMHAVGDIANRYKQQSQSISKSNHHDVQLIYNQKLDTIGTNFTLTSTTQYQFSDNDNQLFVADQLASKILSDNDFIYSQTKFDFETPVKKINGNLSLGTHYTHSVSSNNGVYFWNQDRNYIPYDFKYTNKAAYTSISSNVKSLMISAGLRWEDLTYETATSVDSLNVRSNYNNLFPTITLKYPLISGVYLSAGYNKRMNLPGGQAFNPNVSSQNSLLVSNAGNPDLKPEISHNGNLTLTVFDYIYFSYNLTQRPNQNVIFYDVAANGTLESKYHNIANGQSQSFNMGIPIPYAIFTKGIKNMIADRNGLNIDELSFTYLNAGYFKTKYDAVIPEKFQRGSFYIFTYSQFYLGNNTHFYLTYYNMFKGVMNLYELNKPAQNLNVSLNKKFLDKKFTLNIGVDNVLNNDGYDVNVFGNGLQMRTQTWNERRMFKIGLTYNFGSFKDQSQGMFPQATPPFQTN